MNEELEKQLAELIKKSIELAEQTGEFVIDQASDLIQQFFMWHIAENILYIVLFLIVGLVANKIGLSIGTKEEDFNDKGGYDSYITIRGRRGVEEIMIFGNVLFCLFPLLISSIVIFNCIKDLIFILVAPKLYLVEYFL